MLLNARRAAIAAAVVLAIGTGSAVAAASTASQALYRWNHDADFTVPQCLALPTSVRAACVTAAGYQNIAKRGQNPYAERDRLLARFDSGVALSAQRCLGLPTAYVVDCVTKLPRADWPPANGGTPATPGVSCMRLRSLRWPLCGATTQQAPREVTAGATVASILAWCGAGVLADGNPMLCYAVRYASGGSFTASFGDGWQTSTADQVSLVGSGTELLLWFVSGDVFYCPITDDNATSTIDACRYQFTTLRDAGWNETHYFSATALRAG